MNRQIYSHTCCKMRRRAVTSVRMMGVRKLQIDGLSITIIVDRLHRSQLSRLCPVAWPRHGGVWRWHRCPRPKQPCRRVLHRGPNWTCTTRHACAYTRTHTACPYVQRCAHPSICVCPVTCRFSRLYKSNAYTHAKLVLQS